MMTMIFHNPADRARRVAAEKAQIAHRQAVQQRAAQVQIAVGEHMSNARVDYDTAFMTVANARPELFANTPPMPPGPASLIERLREHPDALQMPTGHPTAQDRAVAEQAHAQFDKVKKQRAKIIAGANERAGQVMKLLAARLQTHPQETYNQRWQAVAEANPEIFAAMNPAARTPSTAR